MYRVIAYGIRTTPVKKWRVWTPVSIRQFIRREDAIDSYNSLSYPVGEGNKVEIWKKKELLLVKLLFNKV